MKFTLVISADSHFVEPFDLWEKPLRAKFGDKVPRLVNNYKGQEGRFFACPGPAEVEPFPAEGITNLEGTINPEEAQEMLLAGYDPAQRERCLERAKVAAEVIYPTFGLFIMGSEDAELKKACCAVYNDWIAEFCSHNRSKFYGVAMVATEDVAWAVKELERMARKGIRAAMIPVVPQQGQPLYHESDYESLWAAAQDLQIPLSLHAITGRVPDPLTFFDKNKRKREGPRRFVELLQEIAPTLADIICGGVLDRFPRLSLVSCEYEVSWLPYLMFRVDQIQKDFGHTLGVRLKKKASDYIRENVWSVMIDDPFSISMRHMVGVDRTMWSSDFPHPRCVYLNTHQILGELLQDVPLEEGQQIVAGNVTTLYRLSEVTSPLQHER